MSDGGVSMRGLGGGAHVNMIANIGVARGFGDTGS
jgi:hypothetical protein